MRRAALLLVAATSIPSLAGAQVQLADRSRTAARIENAMSAAPKSLASAATIMDWPATEGGSPVELRKGTNGFTCFPDIPMSEGNDPMCVDDQWMKWMSAWMSKQPVQLDHLGIGYMIAPGGGSGSNTDPYAKGRTDENEWGHDAPHLMIIVPDLKALEELPTKRQKAAPWVMWTGTPYAHIMIPVVDATP